VKNCHALRATILKKGMLLEEDCRIFNEMIISLVSENFYPMEAQETITLEVFAAFSH